MAAQLAPPCSVLDAENSVSRRERDNIFAVLEAQVGHFWQKTDSRDAAKCVMGLGSITLKV